MSADQLHMVRHSLDGLPELEVPDGYELRTYRPGDEQAWAEIMSPDLGEWTAEKCLQRLTGEPRFLLQGLFFATHEGKPVGSACAWRDTPDEWTRGVVHMVCVLPEHRGRRIGYVLVLAVLRFFREHGFKEVLLSTDDHRLPAIKSYLRLGFEPHYFNDSHRERWSKVFASLG